VEDLFDVLALDLDPSVTSAVVLQIGIAGDKTAIPRLSKYRDRQHDPEIVHNCGLALARLGDLSERRRIVEQLSDPELNTRVRALRDTHYLADRRLAMHFLPALEDRRDAAMISGPHEVPPRYARVCDIAIQALSVLGWELSFNGRVLQRHDEQRIAEAIALVRTIR
jgi:HEAT repeat protein